ncbi:alpha/beta hydrolase [Lactiplantibacillus mudanjiangensis]|uniref:Acyltransferase [Lactobacillus sp.] n=1 Tax=Lactiplantibacillus mudanjiangensis TaxID=1296538 RepID=A0A660E2N1_9LACO|nr:alpha/beta hydrolase [Lactiplantibacillus mudanjiangensis]VDG17601.1 acyltransferase [Lactobacillus sp.] [Lactiplantibacillus mudanjiangensis]VDG23147.1 acyltransferase [Lactobacillus sp.] [Lactiplantibacillus mudanjiangensis]VDG29596.1 acyltransferase [Lactobacillus sp.] [Lactiplantibacillus mudanjiangensis]
MKRNWWKWLLGVVVLIGISWPAYTWSRANIKTMKNAGRTRMAPVIMVPGSSASQNRFDSLIKELGKETPQKHSVLKLTVATDGSIKYSGSIRRNDYEPFIVVGFENNKDGKANIDKQAVWLNTAFKDLVKTYRFNHFRALGHSNGGLIWTLFLERYLKESPKVSIDRFMTIASPYNMESTSTTPSTDMYKELYKYREGLPNSLTMYSIAGTENYTSDGTVPYNSVNAGKYIFQNQIKHFTEITVTGANTTHSDLPQNKQIVALIRQYLLEENVPNKIRKQNQRRLQNQ